MTAKIKKNWISVLVLSALVAVSLMTFSWHSRTRSRKLKVGIGVFPPFSNVSKTAGPSGFVYDLVTEASRRSGREIEWVQIFEGGPDARIDSGEVDLFPFMALTEERLVKYAFSSPWWENSLGLVSDEAAPVSSVEQANRSRIAVIDLAFGRRMASREFPKAQITATKSFIDLIQALCSRQVDAVMIDQRTLNRLWTEGIPSCQGRKLVFHWFPQLSLKYGVGTRKNLQAEADALQAEIAMLGLDGTMTAIGEKWGIWVPNQASMVRDSVIIRGRNLFLIATTMLAFALLGWMFWLNCRARSARRAAEAALRTKDRFLAMISHEIRTPLNGVLGMAELLRATPLDRRQRAHLDAIRGSGEVLLSVINDLLDFSRLEAGTLPMESTIFSPAKAAEDAALMMAGQAEANHVRVLVVVESHHVPATMRGDPTRTRQILGNLISNATKFARNGQVMVRVARSERASGMIRFSVQDNGIGIAPEAQKRLFQPFVQADDSISRKFGGAGLGLAICRHFTHALGGEIGVESALGEGSLFWVELPVGDVGAESSAGEPPRAVRHVAGLVADRQLREALTAILGAAGYLVEWMDEWPLPASRYAAVVVDADPVKAADCSSVIVRIPEFGVISSRTVLDQFSKQMGAAEPEPAPVRATLGLRLLVAEDNTVNQKVIGAMLGQLGCDVEFAANGEEAVELSNSDTFDAVLMDINMPVMDGLEATRRIRERFADLPIVALSAAAEFHSDQEAWRTAGMNEFLSKPLDLPTLRALLQRIESAKTPSAV